jgi:DNA mismatch endonuclease (patch repair protein)
MADTISKKKRSEVMSKIRAKDTKPEKIVRSLLHRRGFRFRLHSKNLPGKPDICLPKYHTVIFVHGCFWHNHKRCRDGKLPKSNLGYWVPKIQGNVKRDKKNKRALKYGGWRIITIWECQIKKPDELAKICRKIKRR